MNRYDWIAAVAQTEVRWGIIGGARMQERIMPALMETARSRVVAMSSRTESVAVARTERWNVQRAYGSYDELLKDPDIDAVYIALPNALHTAWSLRALNAGKHVLCEKPLAVAAEDVDQLARRARLNGRIVQEANMMAFHAQTGFVRDHVTRGALGEIRLLRGVFAFSLRRPRDYRLNPTMGGGCLLDLGCYAVSFMRQVLQREPTSVRAWQRLGPTGIDLTFAGHLHFGDQTLGTFEVSFEAFPHWGAEIVGTQGALALDHPWLHSVGDTATVSTVSRRNDADPGAFSSEREHLERSAVPFSSIRPYHDQVKAMVATVLDGAPPTITLESSRANAATLEALAQAARSGRMTPVRAAAAAVRVGSD